MYAKGTLIQIVNYGMGNGPEDLSLTLIESYFKLLILEKRFPKAITFYNSGVKLICDGSPIIDMLKTIEQAGVTLIACKTCLNYFELANSVSVGMIGTMSDIIEMQTLAGKVINL